MADPQAELWLICWQFFLYGSILLRLCFGCEECCKSASLSADRSGSRYGFPLRFRSRSRSRSEFHFELDPGWIRIRHFTMMLIRSFSSFCGSGSTSKWWESTKLPLRPSSLSLHSSIFSLLGSRLRLHGFILNLQSSRVSFRGCVYADLDPVLDLSFTFDADVDPYPTFFFDADPDPGRPPKNWCGYATLPADTDNIERDKWHFVGINS